MDRHHPEHHHEHDHEEEHHPPPVVPKGSVLVFVLHLVAWFFPSGHEADSPAVRRRQLVLFLVVAVLLISLVYTVGKSSKELLQVDEKELARLEFERQVEAEKAKREREAEERASLEGAGPGMGSGGGGRGDAKGSTDQGERGDAGGAAGGEGDRPGGSGGGAAPEGGGGGGTSGAAGAGSGAAGGDSGTPGEAGGGSGGGAAGAAGEEVASLSPRLAGLTPEQRQRLEQMRRERAISPYDRWSEKGEESRFGRMEEVMRQRRQQKAAEAAAKGLSLDPRDQLLILRLRTERREDGSRVVTGLLVNTSTLLLKRLEVRLEGVDARGGVVHDKKVDPLVVSGGVFGDVRRDLQPDRDHSFEIAVDDFPASWQGEVRATILDADFQE